MSVETQLNLETQLQYAHSCLLYHLDEKYVNSEQQIPRYYIRKAKAIIFLTTRKHLLNTLSQGIALFRLSKKNWSAPCSVGVTNEKNNLGSLLDTITFTETDYILLILDQKIVSSFIESGKVFFQNHADEVHIMDGPLGRNAICSKDLAHDDKPLADTLCYAIRRNAITNDVSKINPHGHSQWLLNYEIFINNEDNYKYYSRLQDDKFCNQDFLTNKMPSIRDKYYCEIIEFLNTYSRKPAKLNRLFVRNKNKVDENIIKNTNQNLVEVIHPQDTNSNKDKNELITNVNNTMPKEVKTDYSHVEVITEPPTIKENHFANPQQLENPKEYKHLQGVATKQGIFYTTPSIPARIMNDISNTMQKLTSSVSSSLNLKEVKNATETKEPFISDEVIKSESVDTLEPAPYSAPYPAPYTAPETENKNELLNNTRSKNEVNPPMERSPAALQPTIDL